MSMINDIYLHIPTDKEKGLFVATKNQRIILQCQGWHDNVDVFNACQLLAEKDGGVVYYRTEQTPRGLWLKHIPQPRNHQST